MDPDDQAYDDFEITEEAPDPAPARQEPAFDMRAFAAEMARSNAETLKAVLAEVMPKPAPAKQHSPGEALRAKLRDDLGLGDAVGDSYARAAALDALGDEWGDDPAVKSAIQQRTGNARLIEAMAEQNRRYKALEERLNKRESDERTSAERSKQLAQLEQLAAEGGLRKIAPNVFAGPQLTPEHKELLASLDVPTLERVLPVLDKLMASARPRSRRLGAAPGGSGREKERPFRIVPDSEWDEHEQRRIGGEEMN